MNKFKQAAIKVAQGGAAAAAALAAGVSQAAVDAGVTTAITTATTDGQAVANGLLLLGVAIFGVMYIKRKFFG